MQSPDAYPLQDPSEPRPVVTDGDRELFRVQLIESLNKLTEVAEYLLARTKADIEELSRVAAARSPQWR